MVQDGIGLIGQTLEGRYFLTRALGQGGMGVVFEALDLARGERCAVKIQKLPADAPNIHTGLQRRFRREALLGQRVRHDGLVAVYDVGELPGGASFLVMELLDGWCLFDVLTGVGPLPWPEAVELALQAAGALAALHRAGIIHRDIKPENLQLLSDGRLKVLDLGVLRVQEGLAVGDAEDTDVRTGSKEALGTIAFMAPEQIQDNARVDGRTDLYALGLVLWEALTGEQPFRGLSWVEVTQRKFSPEPMPPLRTRVAEAPAVLEALVARCLGEQERRPASAEALIGALAPLLAEPALELRRRLVQRVRLALPEAGEEALGQASTPAVSLAWSGASEVVVRGRRGTPLLPPAGPRDEAPTDRQPRSRSGARALERSDAGGRESGAGDRESGVAGREAPRRWWPPRWLGGVGVGALLLWGTWLVTSRTARVAPVGAGAEPSLAAVRSAAPAQTPGVRGAGALGGRARGAGIPALRLGGEPGMAAPPARPAAGYAALVGARARGSTDRSASAGAEPAAPGRLYIAVHPFAEVYIDGQHRDEATPHTYVLAPGRHTVRFLNSARGIDETRVVRLAADGSERLVIDWDESER